MEELGYLIEYYIFGINWDLTKNTFFGIICDSVCLVEPKIMLGYIKRRKAYYLKIPFSGIKAYVYEIRQKCVFMQENGSNRSRNA